MTGSAEQCSVNRPSGWLLSAAAVQMAALPKQLSAAVSRSVMSTMAALEIPIRRIWIWLTGRLEERDRPDHALRQSVKCFVDSR